MSFWERFRHNFSACVLWCAFLALYLGGTFLLVIGLVVSLRTWWAIVHQHAGAWQIVAKTSEVLILAIGFVLILIVPLLRRRAASRRGAWRTDRRSGTKSQEPAAE